MGKLAFALTPLDSVRIESMRERSKGFIVGSGIAQNAIFDLSHPSNRDGCFEPYVAMRHGFADRGFSLDTADLFDGGDAAFELHMDVREPLTSAANYLLLLETPQIWPANGISDNWLRYRKVFTWRDDLVDGERFVKLNFPNLLAMIEADGWTDRPRFCCMIAGNKATAVADLHELYTERVRAIRWFEGHAPADFELFGVDWDLPPPRAGLLGKIHKRVGRYVSRLWPRQPFPSYRGRIASKQNVLKRTRFAICYENVRDLPGYITEKIFDCFLSACVPVYWGAGNVTNHIPEGCFIDRRAFTDTSEVYRFLKCMTEDEYRVYQERIAAFLAGPGARQFGADHFVQTIVNTVVSDLEHPA